MPKNKNRYLIGTAFTTATRKALKESSMRLKSRVAALVNKTKKKMTGMSKKLDRNVAKKIRSITKRSH